MVHFAMLVTVFYSVKSFITSTPDRGLFDEPLRDGQPAVHADSGQGLVLDDVHRRLRKVLLGRRRRPRRRPHRRHLPHPRQLHGVVDAGGGVACRPLRANPGS